MTDLLASGRSNMSDHFAGSLVMVAADAGSIRWGRRSYLIGRCLQKRDNSGDIGMPRKNIRAATT